MASTIIRFPVLKSLKVSDYELFPGKNGEGIDHTFQRGVTVVVGVNGLGKTTLLTIILRTLVGFSEPAKFDPYDPGTGSHKMVDKETSYFASRTTNLAKQARVDAEFEFGKQTLRIVRRLDTLAIERLSLNGKRITGEQHDLQQVIVKASGLSTLYDLFYVVRSFTFFLEDKVSLIWNPRGQFEIFRILFFDPTKAKEFADLADKIQRLDSKYRNLRVYYNKSVKELDQKAGKKDDASISAEELRLKRVDANTLEETDAAIRRSLEKALEKRSAVQERLAKTRLDLEEDRRHHEGLLESFFSRAFPDLPAVVSNVLNQLDSGHGCLVCGTQPKQTKKFREMASKGICPFCETKNVRTEQRSTLSANAEKEIKTLDVRIESTRKSIIALETALTAAQAEAADYIEQRSINSSKLTLARGEVERLEATLPLGKEEIDETRRKLDGEARQLREIRLEIEEKTARYATLLEEGRKTIEQVATKLTERFTYYAGEFLAETSSLAYREQKRVLGQEGEQLNYPNFHVEMTSATSPKLGTARMEDTEVSESQKEFIDLAFRMALFDAVRQPDDGVMLVIETPEASLDTVFVNKAGTLLRKFAEEATLRPNVVITSCNLNSAGMVRSLLGIDSLSKTAAKQANTRIINLLEVAAPNAAMRKYGKIYRAELATALKKL